MRDEILCALIWNRVLVSIWITHTHSLARPLSLSSHLFTFFSKIFIFHLLKIRCCCCFCFAAFQLENRYQSHPQTNVLPSVGNLHSNNCNWIFSIPVHQLLLSGKKVFPLNLHLGHLSNIIIKHHCWIYSILFLSVRQQIDK